jgi:toxin ParE1/3/4
MLRWTQRTRADLKAIHDYIAKGAPLNSKVVVRDIWERASQLPATPRIGRIVPELQNPDIREVPVHSWRVIYQLRGDKLFIVTLVHRRRAPAPEDLQS